MNVYKSMIGRSALATAFVPSVLLALCVPHCACTVFFAFDGKLALAGQNEDWDDTNTQLWVVPRTSTTYGVLYFGFGRGDYPEGGVRISPRLRDLVRSGITSLDSITEEDLYGLPQQGINEKGLFFGGAQTQMVDSQRRADRPTYDGHIVDFVMRHCATVSQALKILDDYEYVMPAGQLLFGDKFGDSFILEPGRVVIRRSGNYQVITNFLQSREPDKKRKDRRYMLAASKLAREPRLSRKIGVSLLQETHQSNTQYSLVFDLSHRVVIVYRKARFDSGIELNVDAELSKGSHAERIQDLFEATSPKRRPNLGIDRSRAIGFRIVP